MDNRKTTGKGGKSYGAKRIHKSTKDVILGITKPAIRRLARRGEEFIKQQKKSFLELQNLQ